MQPPPSYSQYPRPGTGGGIGGGMGYRGPGVYFDFIGTAFTMVTRNAGVYIVGALLAAVIVYAVQLPASLAANFVIYGRPMGANVRPGELPEMNLMIFPVSILFGVIPGAVAQALNVGLTLCAVEEADTGQTQIGTMFQGFRNFLPLIGTSFIFQIAVNLGLLLLIVPGLILGAGLAFAPILTVTEGLNPIEACSKSFRMVKDHIPMLILYFILSVIIMFSGLCACCIGVLVTMPMLYVGLGLHYREFRGPVNQVYATVSGPAGPTAPYAPTAPATTPGASATPAPAAEAAPEGPPEPAPAPEPTTEPTPEAKPDADGEGKIEGS